MTTDATLPEPNMERTNRLARQQTVLSAGFSRLRAGAIACGEALALATRADAHLTSEIGTGRCVRVSWPPGSG
jgi:hypothetical protein